MFPDVISIFHLSKDGERDTYTKYVVPGVYVYGKDSVSNGDKAESKTGGIVCVTNPSMTRNFGTRWKAEAGDRIVIGIYEGDITKFSDIPAAFVVSDVAANIIGTTANVVIKAR